MGWVGGRGWVRISLGWVTRGGGVGRVGGPVARAGSFDAHLPRALSAHRTRWRPGPGATRILIAHHLALALYWTSASPLGPHLHLHLTSAPPPVPARTSAAHAWRYFEFRR